MMEGLWLFPTFSHILGCFLPRKHSFIRNLLGSNVTEGPFWQSSSFATLTHWAPPLARCNTLAEPADTIHSTFAPTTFDGWQKQKLKKPGFEPFFFFAGGNSLLDNCALGYPSRIRSEIACSQWQIFQSWIKVYFASEVRGKATGFRKFFAKNIKNMKTRSSFKSHFWCSWLARRTVKWLLLGSNPSEGISFLKRFSFFANLMWLFILLRSATVWVSMRRTFSGYMGFWIRFTTGTLLSSSNLYFLTRDSFVTWSSLHNQLKLFRWLDQLSFRKHLENVKTVCGLGGFA